jgi:ATP-dependent helicase HrpB
MQQHDGDVLAFLPGAYEIQRTESLLITRNTKAVVLPLYGELPPEEQQRALLPDPSGRRKIVLSTPIAETSVTIDGVRIVVDSGYHKISRSDTPGSTLLKTERISRDSSEQRAGRAGRTAPGVCIRLWSEQEQLALREFREPEVLRVDLSSIVLDLAAWGVRNPAEFGWITEPPHNALDAALRLLHRIGALNPDNSLSADGRVLADLGAHPLLGKLALVSRRHGLEPLAARLLALIEERDLLGGNAASADIQSRLALLTREGGNVRTRRALQLTERWERRIVRLPKPAPQASAGVRIAEDQQVAFLLAQAFPLTIAQRRDADGCRYLMANGRGCALRHNDPLKQSEHIVVVELKEEVGDGRVALAASLDTKLFDGPLAHLCAEESSVAFDPQRGQLQSTKRRICGAITLSESSGEPASLEAQREALALYLSTAEGFAQIPFSSTAERLRLRVQFARQTQGALELPDLTNEQLQTTLTTWLAPFLLAPFKVSALSAEVVDVALHSLLPYSLTQRLSELAPDRITLPSGRERAIEYSWDGKALLQATIQELFGMRDTPRLGNKKAPVTIHLLSPAKRPMQVTQDLAGFWATGYQAVRKELRGRYPKHAWPEDPTVALPARGKRER